MALDSDSDLIMIVTGVLFLASGAATPTSTPILRPLIPGPRPKKHNSGDMSVGASYRFLPDSSRGARTHGLGL
jgi:hypothetical protein